MPQIHQFQEISDYVRTARLNVESKLPDFLLLNYENLNLEGHHQLSAYRHHYIEINFDITPGCSLKVDQFELPSQANRLMFVSPHRLQSYQVDTTGTAEEEPYKGYGLLFYPEFVNANPAHYQFLHDFPFFSPFNAPSVTLNRYEVTDIMDIILRIQYEYDNYGVYSKEIIKHYLNILLLKAKSVYQVSSQQINTISREQEIYHAFEALVQKHFLELNTVKAYADKMYISPKHLSETVKKVSGQSALQLIHKAQLNYARSLLQHTSKTVSEIAYELNFESPDYFSVFFKRLTGKSPLQFRIS